MLAALLLAVATLLTYGLTSEYGYSPNDDPASDLTNAAAGNAIGALLVAALAASGLVLVQRRPPRRTLLTAVGAFVVAFVVIGLGTALGQWALDARCAGPDRFSTGAC